MAMYMLPGMPNLYYGDEVGIKGRLGSNEGARFPMEWREEYWDMDMLSFHRAMGNARKEKWLGYASYRIEEVDEKAFAVLRFTDHDAYVALVNRGEKREVKLDIFALPSDRVEIVYGKGEAKTEGKELNVSFEEKESILIKMWK